MGSRPSWPSAGPGIVDAVDPCWPHSSWVWRVSRCQQLVASWGVRQCWPLVLCGAKGFQTLLRWFLSCLSSTLEPWTPLVPLASLALVGFKIFKSFPKSNPFRTCCLGHLILLPHWANACAGLSKDVQGIWIQLTDNPVKGPIGSLEHALPYYFENGRLYHIQTIHLLLGRVWNRLRYLYSCSSLTWNQRGFQRITYLDRGSLRLYRRTLRENIQMPSWNTLNNSDFSLLPSTLGDSNRCNWYDSCPHRHALWIKVHPRFALSSTGRLSDWCNGAISNCAGNKEMTGKKINHP